LAAETTSHIQPPAAEAAGYDCRHEDLEMIATTVIRHTTVHYR